jgi:signal transduction histidine kinase/ligand-binding sensor domain-containing protein
MKTRASLAVALVVAAASRAHALDPQRAPSQYVISNWEASALQSSTVRALLQTKDGYLWLGTGAGLLRYDGARFVPVGASDTAAFGDGGVASLAEGTDGALYFGTTGGTVIRSQDGAFTRVPMRDGTGPIHALLAAADGGLWMAQYGYPVARWQPGQTAAKYLTRSHPSPLALAEAPDGTVWIGAREGLVQARGDQWEPSPITGDAVQALAVDRAGALWIGTPHGLLRHGAGSSVRFTVRDGLAHDSVTSLLEDRDGNMWVGTAGGLSRWRAGRFETLTAAAGLADDDVRSLLEDREGNVWVGTADGLTELSDGRFVTYGRPEGLHDPSVASVVGAREGGVWIGTASAEVVHLHPGGRVEVFRLPEGLGRESITHLYEAKDGLWIVVDNGRLFRLQSGRIHEVTPPSSKGRRGVRSVFEDEAGLIGLSVDSGLTRLKGGEFVPVAPAAPDFNYPHTVTRDAQGTLWIGASRGLLRVRGAEYHMFLTSDGLPHNRVRWISSDEDGSLWIATAGGLAHLEGDAIQKVTIQEGLPENYLRCVLDDGLGHLWVASLGNLFRLDKAELHALFTHQLTRVTPLRFDASDGLRATEGLLTNNPGFRAADGRLWFATVKGAVVVDPRRVSTDRPAPPVTIESLAVDGQTRDLHAAREYGPGRGEIVIEYASLTFTAPHKVQFRYRLDGFDKEWVVSGTRRFAHYGALPAGRYRFDVMASNPDGLWTGAPASIDFAVRPPFFRTPVFYLLCIVALAAAAAGAHRLRLGRMRERFAAIIGERTRIARELHDTLAQGVAGVGLQIETALRAIDHDPDTAREQLRLAHGMAKSSLAEVRRSIWVLRAQTAKGRDGLAASLSESLRQLIAGKGPHATVQVFGHPRPLPVAVERNLLRIAHEAVSNAVRHSDADTMSVVLDFAPEGLLLRVTDDGRGFDFDAHLAASGVEHFGLLGIVERARALGGELRVRSGAGQGTEVFCRIPYGARADSAEREMDAGDGADL